MPSEGGRERPPSIDAAEKHVNTCPRCQRAYDDGVRFCSVDGSPLLAIPDPGIARNIGRVLYGQFELRELAGRGATGTVWRAYQRSMDRIVAVKILHRELARDSDIVRRFLREARAIAKITHPNIVTVHMVGETEEGTPYLVMEHVDGISLETVVEAQGPQPTARVVHVGRQIALGLAEAHANGIIHRDLKPANLLVTDRGRVADQVKILDFGIAKLVQAGDEISQITRGQQVFGTPHYMAPEQASGDPIDARTDLYALGVVLFRLSTGEVPFDAPAGMQVVLRHLRDAPPRPREINPLVPVAMEMLILQCMAKKPADRPRDAEDVIATLDELAVAEGLKGLWPPSPSQRANLPATPPPPPRPSTTDPELVLGSYVEDPTQERMLEPARTPVRVASHVGAALTGIQARPKERRDRSAWVLITFVLFIGAALYALTHFGGGTGSTIATETLARDLSMIVTPLDASQPPPADLAMPKKRHHRDDEDLPTTVFGPETAK